MDNYYLDYIQVMMLMHRIEEMKNSNLYLDDNQVVSSFISYAMNRTTEIAMAGASIRKKKDDKYEIPRVMVDYLIKLTGADIFDKTAIKEFGKTLKQIESDGKNKFFSGR